MFSFIKPANKASVFFALIVTTLANSVAANSPPNITTDIEWVDTGGAGIDASYSGVLDIEKAFNHARREEEQQLGLAANSIADLILPPQAIWDNMSDNAKALYLLNNERTSRASVFPDVLGLAFSGVEANIDSIASDYATLLHDTNAIGHYQPSGDPSIDNPNKRISDNPVIGSALDCHEPIARSETLAYFTAYSNTVIDASSIPLPIERAIFSWIYKDSTSGWENRETVLLQDQGVGTTAGDAIKGFTNNYNGQNHEGFIGIHRTGSSGYTPFTVPSGQNTYAEVVVLNMFDPVSDADAQVRGCQYSVLLHTDDLPKTINRAPVAVDDNVSTRFNRKTQPIEVLRNDSDPDHDPLHITQFSEPSNGSLERVDDSFIYIPNDGFSGTDSFTYTITDGNFEETTAIATAAAVAIYSPDVVFTDTDTFSFTISGHNGVATADATGTASITYDPNDTPNSTETVTFTISNALNGEAIATATATATASNADATATASAKAIAIYSPDTIISNTDAITYTISQGVGEAIADATAIATVEFKPSDDVNGNGDFTYTVLNSNGEEVPATTIAMAMATATATVTALTAETATVNIDVAENAKPSFTLKQTTFTVDSDAGKIDVPGWVAHAEDGEGGTQLPFGGDTPDVIYFYITSNSNPALFSEQPWISYPSQALHFTPERDKGGTAKICMKAVDRHGDGLSSEIQCFTITVKQIPNNPPGIVIKSPAHYEVNADAGKIDVPGWVSEAPDGDGGIQLPFGGDSKDIIHFDIISNSNPDLFIEQPWISYPSQALHFTPKSGSQGSAEICAISIDRAGKGLSSPPACFTITVIDNTRLAIYNSNFEDSSTPDPVSSPPVPSTEPNANISTVDSQTQAPSRPLESDSLPKDSLSVVASNSETKENFPLENAQAQSSGGGVLGIVLEFFLIGLGLIRRKYS